MTKLIGAFRNYANGLNASCSCAVYRVGHLVLRRADQPSVDGGGCAGVEPAALHAALHTTNRGDYSVRGSL